MGIFQHKKDEEQDGVLHFFDDYFREDLRKRGREYFEKVIDDDAALFKKDLDQLIVQANDQLKEHITKQLDATIAQINADMTKQFEGHLAASAKAIQEAHDASLQAIEKREQAIEQQHEELSAVLQKSVTNQEATLVSTYKENMARINQMNEAQGVALQMLNRSTQTLEQQYQQLTAMLQNTVKSQEDMLVGAFEQNMSRVIEHYLLGALGDQFDLKAQLPAIIQQMEASKKEIVEDMKL